MTAEREVLPSSLPQPVVVTDSEERVLLRRLRSGEDAAFGELFEAHAAAVRRLAYGMAADSAEAEDITAETFFRVLQALRRGSGPRDHVRAYLLTVARRVCWEWHGARRDVPVSDDELTSRAGVGADAHASSAERSLIARAFISLPERWRTVLWQTEVEGEQPAVVAPNLGLSPNATAALARRARQGLRAAYLQAHLGSARRSESCRTALEKLGAYTAGSVTGSEATKIRTHLLGCSSCSDTHDELREVCHSLRADAGAVLLLLPVAAGGLSAAGGGPAGLLTTLKGLLFGSKVKVGVALASTAAAGAVGIVGPAMLDRQGGEIVGLPGPGSPELTVAGPAPSPPSSVLTDQQILHFLDRPRYGPVRPGTGAGNAPGVAGSGPVAGLPAGALPGASGVRLPAGSSGADDPLTGTSVPGGSSDGTKPRIDPDGETGSGGDSPESGQNTSPSPMLSSIPEESSEPRIDPSYDQPEQSATTANSTADTTATASPSPSDSEPDGDSGTGEP